MGLYFFEFLPFRLPAIARRSGEADGDERQKTKRSSKSCKSCRKKCRMKLEDITHKIIGAAYQVYNQLARPPRLSEPLN